jgi:hypothetical protein
LSASEGKLVVFSGDLEELAFSGAVLFIVLLLNSTCARVTALAKNTGW